MNKKLILIIVIALGVLVVGGYTLLQNKKLKDRQEARKAELAKQALETPKPEEKPIEEIEEKPAEPESEYKRQLGLDLKQESDRVVIKEPEPVKPKKPKPKPKYRTTVTVFDNTSVPKRNQDGTRISDYLRGITLKSFSGAVGGKLTKDDFKGGNLHLVGYNQNPEDYIKQDLQSTGWLIENLDKLKPSDAVKFTNLNVITHLATNHVAMLCSYNWYSIFGLKDTLVLFEDMSGTLKISDFKEGDIFSATVFVHNITVLPNVNGQRVIVVAYTRFKEELSDK